MTPLANALSVESESPEISTEHPQRLPSKLKIAYVSDQVFPNTKADAEQVTNNLSGLLSVGTDVRLVIPRDWRDRDLSDEDRTDRIQEFYSLENRVHVHSVLGFPFSRLRLEKLSHAFLGVLYAKRSGFDLVYSRNPLVACTSLLLGFPVVFETYRILKRKGLKAAWIRWILKNQRTVAILTHSTMSGRALEDLGIPKEKIRTLHNGYNREVLEKVVSKSDARRKLKWSGLDKIALYTGRVDLDKGIRNLVDLAEHLPDVRFVFVGPSQKGGADWLLSQKQEKALENIDYLPFVPARELSDYLFAADLLLIPPSNEPMKVYGKTVLPIKTFLYMGAGRPILAPRSADLLDVLNDRNSFLVEPDNLFDAKKTTQEIFSNPEMAEIKAQQAKADSRSYTWEARAERIANFLSTRVAS